MAKEVRLPNWNDWDDYSKHDEMFDAMMDISNNLPDGEIVGGMLGFPYADGKAWYVVLKEKPLTVANVPEGDAWQVHEAFIRGLNKTDVLGELRYTRAIREAFGKKVVVKND